MVEVTPVMVGPDYTGWVDITATATSGEFSTHFVVDLVDARRLFSELGDVLKLIEANADPS